MLGDYLARRGQQNLPVACGVGALGSGRSPGDGLVHGAPTLRLEYNRGKVRLRLSG
jgi:hypothetical protein